MSKWLVMIALIIRKVLIEYLREMMTPVIPLVKAFFVLALIGTMMELVQMGIVLDCLLGQEIHAESICGVK